MKTIIIKFPQIIVEFKDVLVSDEEHEAIINGDLDRSKFIWDNLTELEQNHVPNGQKGIESGLECDMANIKTITNIPLP